MIKFCASFFCFKTEEIAQINYAKSIYRSDEWRIPPASPPPFGREAISPIICRYFLVFGIRRSPLNLKTRKDDLGSGQKVSILMAINAVRFHQNAKNQNFSRFFF